MANALVSTALIAILVGACIVGALVPPAPIRIRPPTKQYLVPVGGSPIDEGNVWTSRRKVIRITLLPVLENMARRLSVNATDGAGIDTMLQQQTKEERSLAKAKRRDSEARYGILVTTFFVAVGAAVLRLGGRGALLNLLGLDFIQGANIQSQVDSFVDTFQSLGSLGTLGFFAGWLVAKVFCLDFIGVTLALSSGVLFGGVLEGTLASVIFSVAASVVVFLLSRYTLQDQIRPEIEKRSLLRAVDGAVAKEGFKTVFVLRLSPLLPIPIGAYNYIYGVTKLKLSAFVGGIGLASFKPYFLDSYLGVFGKSVMDKTEDGGTQDALLLIVLGAIIAVGTLATQVAGTVYDEIKLEAKNFDQSKQGGLVSADPDSPAPAASTGLVSYIFGLLDGKNLPGWASKIQSNMGNTTDKINAILKDEVVSLIEEQKVGFDFDFDSKMVIRNQTALPLPVELKSEAETKVLFMEKYFSDSSRTLSYQYPGVRELREFERDEDVVNLQALLDSFVFSFVLFGWLFTLLDEDKFVDTVE